MACGGWRVRGVLDMEALGKGPFPVLLSSKNSLGKCFLFHLIIIKRSPVQPSTQRCAPERVRLAHRKPWRRLGARGEQAVQEAIGHFSVHGMLWPGFQPHREPAARNKTQGFQLIPSY